MDELSAAKVRLALVEQAMPGLCAAHERYEAEQRVVALVAVHGPHWSTAAAEKATALSTITTLLGQLKTAQEAYAAAHGAQLACLRALPLYTGPYRANYAPMVARLGQIISTVVGGDATWLSKVTTFDTIGTSAALPREE